MPSAVWFGLKREAKEGLKYRYDASGNISEITQNGHIAAKYAYDALGRLIREDNKSMNKTVLFTYDENGNITERCEYGYTSKTGEELTELACTHYGYAYDGDKLISYNGENCAYNALGNPTTYRGKALEWQYGSRLTKFGTTTFAYDGAGRRVSKGNITFTYDSDGRLIKQSDGLEFIYDNSGIAGVKYNGNTYFYRKDAQGNIISLLDKNGSVVVEYKYDAWGNHEAEVTDEEYAVLAEKNPFRYRGYYYDTETNLYYLQTRYYDPEVGRFISRDSIEYAAPESINGLNLYAYCSNNPVMNVDPTGCLLFEIFALLVTSVLVVYQITQTIKSYEYINETYSGVERIGWMLANTFLGYPITSILMFDESKIDWGTTSEAGIKFDFSKNKNYNIFTSILYMKALLKRQNLPEGRTTLGIYIEWVTHHIAHNLTFDLWESARVADMDDIKSDPNGWMFEFLTVGLFGWWIELFI